MSLKTYISGAHLRLNPFSRQRGYIYQEFFIFQNVWYLSFLTHFLRTFYLKNSRIYLNMHFEMQNVIFLYFLIFWGKDFLSKMHTLKAAQCLRLTRDDMQYILEASKHFKESFEQLQNT